MKFNKVDWEVRQGAPVIKQMYVHEKEDCILLYIDMASKYLSAAVSTECTEVDSIYITTDMISIYADNESLHLHRHYDIDAPTDIVLPDKYNGWLCFSVSSGKSDICFCLIKEFEYD